MTENDPNRLVGEEARKTYARKLTNGFIDKYLSGGAILDIGYKGYLQDVVPIVAQAIGVDLDYPGYDGRTLPFPDASQDAVYASHCLEHIGDFRNALRDWFRVLKQGGYMVIVVPHQYLYEKKIALPSRWNADHKRFYTPGALLMDIEDALEPNTWRVRHLIDNDLDFDYSIPPDRHSGGCYEIELVIEKIAPPAWRLAADAPAAYARPTDRPGGTDRARDEGPARIAAGSYRHENIVVRDFGVDASRPRRILVTKLDHFGDFIIALPALEQLREAFPRDHVTLICGPWNEAGARECGLVDEVRTYSFFPPNTPAWDGQPVEGVERFRAVAAGHFDLALDLRVDEDTRFLLELVDASVRCGIGSRARFPFLDIILPAEPRSISSRERDWSAILLGPERFRSQMPLQGPFFHQTDFSVTDTYIIDGPDIALPRGRFRIVYGLRAEGALGLLGTSLTLEILRDAIHTVRRESLKRRRHARVHGNFELEFTNEHENARYEFRVHTGGRTPGTRLKFFGVWLETLEPFAQHRRPRLRPAELHIGERLSLLVQLVSERSRPLYSDTVFSAPNAVGPRVFAELDNIPSGTRRIVVAPVSNSSLRDWPLDKYAELVRVLIEEFRCYVILIGSREQLAQLQYIAQRNEGDGRIVNLGGRTSWSELPGVLRQADLVICNNSGIAHLSAACGARTLAIYSASHQPQEWGPRGSASRAIMAEVSCSPCGYDQLSSCPNEHACMQDITPRIVTEQVAELLGLTSG